MSITWLSLQIPSGLLWLPLSSVSCLISASPSFPFVLLAKWIFLEHCCCRPLPFPIKSNPYIKSNPLLFKACLQRAHHTIYSNLLLLQHKALFKNELPHGFSIYPTLPKKSHVSRQWGLWLKSTEFKNWEEYSRLSISFSHLPYSCSGIWVLKIPY